MLFLELTGGRLIKSAYQVLDTLEVVNSAVVVRVGGDAAGRESRFIDKDAMSEVILKVITVYMYVVLVYGGEGESIPLRAWWLFGSSILAPLTVRKPEPANAARPLRNFCDRHFVNCHWRRRFRSLPHEWW
jgi:hypothetical protein